MRQQQFTAAFIYIIAINAANWLVFAFGPGITPLNAFLLIGLDLTLRDYMHEHLGMMKIVAISIFAGVSSYWLNPAGGQIAVASSVSLIMASLADAGVYQRLIRRTWFKKVNVSNAAGAAVDSVIFPLLAFGALLPWVVAAQFVAKLAGGFVWSLVLRRIR